MEPTGRRTGFALTGSGPLDRIPPRREIERSIGEEEYGVPWKGPPPTQPSPPFFWDYWTQKRPKIFEKNFLTLAARKRRERRNFFRSNFIRTHFL